MAASTAHANEAALLGHPAQSFADEFGLIVDVQGTRVAVGAPGEDAKMGAAYVFDCTTLPCGSAVRVVPGNLDTSDQFGRAIAMSGNTLAIGAPGRDAGTVFIYVLGGVGWALQDVVEPSNASGSARFGRALALDGDTLVVGAEEDQDRMGAAFVYTRSAGNWTERATLRASDRMLGDAFGTSVALSGDTALIGAPFQRGGTAPGAYARGAAYVFNRSGSAWSEAAKLGAADAGNGALFGLAVALEGNRALIGAPSAQNARGAAYVFERSGSAWSQTAQLSSAGGAAGDQFGWSLSVSGAQLVVGAPNANGACGTNNVFVHDGSAWQEALGGTPSQTGTRVLFGWSVSLDGARWAAGAPGRALGTAENAGAVYWFDPGEVLLGDGFEGASGVCRAAARN
jgi:hypothetical protein